MPLEALRLDINSTFKDAGIKKAESAIKRLSNKKATVKINVDTSQLKKAEAMINKLNRSVKVGLNAGGTGTGGTGQGGGSQQLLLENQRRRKLLQAGLSDQRKALREQQRLSTRANQSVLGNRNQRAITGNNQQTRALPSAQRYNVGTPRYAWKGRPRAELTAQREVGANIQGYGNRPSFYSSTANNQNQASQIRGAIAQGGGAGRGFTYQPSQQQRATNVPMVRGSRVPVDIGSKAESALSTMGSTARQQQRIGAGANRATTSGYGNYLNMGGNWAKASPYMTPINTGAGQRGQFRGIQAQTGTTAQRGQGGAYIGGMSNVRQGRSYTRYGHLESGQALSTMVGGMGALFAYDIMAQGMENIRNTITARSEAQSLFKKTGTTLGNMEPMLNAQVAKTPKVNKYNLAETVSGLGVEFDLNQKEMGVASDVVAMLSSEYQRAGRSPEEAALAVKDIAQGEFMRLSRETGVGKEELKEFGYKGNNKDTMNILESVQKAGLARHWDVFAKKDESLQDTTQKMMNRLSESIAPAVDNVVGKFRGAFDIADTVGKQVSNLPGQEILGLAGSTAGSVATNALLSTVAGGLVFGGGEQLGHAFKRMAVISKGETGEATWEKNVTNRYLKQTNPLTGETNYLRNAGNLYNQYGFQQAQAMMGTGKYQSIYQLNENQMSDIYNKGTTTVGGNKVFQKEGVNYLKTNQRVMNPLTGEYHDVNKKIGAGNQINVEKANKYGANIPFVSDQTTQVQDPSKSWWGRRQTSNNRAVRGIGKLGGGLSTMLGGPLGIAMLGGTVAMGAYDFTKNNTRLFDSLSERFQNASDKTGGIYARVGMQDKTKDRKGLDTAEANLAKAKAEEKATKGTKNHTKALEDVNQAQKSYANASKWYKEDLAVRERTESAKAVSTAFENATVGGSSISAWNARLTQQASEQKLATGGIDWGKDDKYISALLSAGSVSFMLGLGGGNKNTTDDQKQIEKTMEGIQTGVDTGKYSAGLGASFGSMALAHESYQLGVQEKDASKIADALQLIADTSEEYAGILNEGRYSPIGAGGYVNAETVSTYGAFLPSFARTGKTVQDQRLVFNALEGDLAVSPELSTQYKGLYSRYNKTNGIDDKEANDLLNKAKILEKTVELGQNNKAGFDVSQIGKLGEATFGFGGKASDLQNIVDKAGANSKLKDYVTKAMVSGGVVDKAEFSVMKHMAKPGYTEKKNVGTNEGFGYASKEEAVAQARSQGVRVANWESYKDSTGKTRYRAGTPQQGAVDPNTGLKVPDPNAIPTRDNTGLLGTILGWNQGVSGANVTTPGVTTPPLGGGMSFGVNNQQVGTGNPLPVLIQGMASAVTTTTPGLGLGGIGSFLGGLFGGGQQQTTAPTTTAPTTTQAQGQAGTATATNARFTGTVQGTANSVGNRFTGTVEGSSNAVGAIFSGSIEGVASATGSNFTGSIGGTANSQSRPFSGSVNGTAHSSNRPFTGTVNGTAHASNAPFEGTVSGNVTVNATISASKTNVKNSAGAGSNEGRELTNSPTTNMPVTTASAGNGGTTIGELKAEVNIKSVDAGSPEEVNDFLEQTRTAVRTILYEEAVQNGKGSE